MGLRGDMFYEIHPQLWNKGIMSEAFDEVLRFAIETVGCVKVVVSPSRSLDLYRVTGGLLG
jgi:RimJ/RimL family protein N-acetyltransferase